MCMNVQQKRGRSERSSSAPRPFPQHSGRDFKQFFDGYFNGDFSGKVKRLLNGVLEIYQGGLSLRT